MGLERVSKGERQKEGERERGLDKNRSTAVATHGSRNDSLLRRSFVCVRVCVHVHVHT